MIFSPPEIFLSLIIPAYNEEVRILEAIRQIDVFLSSFPFSTEVLIMDDGSKDKTAELVAQAIRGKTNFSLVRNGKNQGKGAVVRQGMQLARGQIRLFADADMSTPLTEVPKFINLANSPTRTDGYDVVIGSRRLRGAKILKDQPAQRKLSGFIFRQLVRWIVMPDFVDTQCGFKLLTKQAAEQIFARQKIDRFGFDVEILYLAKKLGFTVKEEPVTWIDSPNSRVSLLRDPMKMVMDLVRIRLGI